MEEVKKQLKLLETMVAKMEEKDKESKCTCKNCPCNVDKCDNQGICFVEDDDEEDECEEQVKKEDKKEVKEVIVKKPCAGGVCPLRQLIPKFRIVVDDKGNAEVSKLELKDQDMESGAPCELFRNMTDFSFSSFSMMDVFLAILLVIVVVVVVRNLMRISALT